MVTVFVIPDWRMVEVDKLRLIVEGDMLTVRVLMFQQELFPSSRLVASDPSIDPPVLLHASESRTAVFETVRLPAPATMCHCVPGVELWRKTRVPVAWPLKLMAAKV